MNAAKKHFTACCGGATIMSCDTDSAASLTTYVWIMATLYTTRNKTSTKQGIVVIINIIIIILF